MNHRTNRRGRSLAVVALAALAIAGGAGCSSGSDEGASDTPAGVPADTASTPTATESGDEVTVTESPAGDDESGVSPECGGITAAEVGDAAGAGDFDSADDLSIDTDTTCLFTNSAGIYGISVSKESADVFLAGDLAGASTDEALSSLETLFTSSIDGATVVRADVNGHQAVIVTGTLLSGGPAGKAGTVVDGVAVVVEADGADLAPDAAGFEPLVSNVLALATSGG